MNKKILLVCFVLLWPFICFCSEKKVILNNPIFSKHFERVGEERIQFLFDSSGIIVEERFLDSNQSFSISIDPENQKMISFNNNEKVLERSITDYLFTKDNNSFTFESDLEKYIYTNGVLFWIRKDKGRIEEYYTYSKIDDCYYISIHQYMADYNNYSCFDDYSNKYICTQDFVKQIKNQNLSVNKFNSQILIMNNFRYLLPFLLMNNPLETEAKSYKCSSELREKNAYYGAENLRKKENLPWASANGYGIGDIIIIELPRVYNLKLDVYNGFQSEIREDLYKSNSRAKRIEIKCKENNKKLIVDLKDTREKQIIELNALGMIYNSYVNLEIKILEVYPGDKYKDLCIQAIIPEY